MTDDEKSKVRLLSRSSADAETQLKPIVLEFKRRKKKDDASSEKNGSDERKIKYSRGLEEIQRLEENAIRIGHKAARSLSKGAEVYERERQQSAKEKTDGAIEDFIHNSAKAASASMKEASDIPIDLAESINTGSYRKGLRKTLKRVSKFIRLWRI